MEKQKSLLQLTLAGWKNILNKYLQKKKSQYLTLYRTENQH